MKIDEPKTPYNYYSEDSEGHSDGEQKVKEIDPENLAELLSKTAKDTFSFDEDATRKFEDDDEMGEEDLAGLTEEEKEKRKNFDSKRKQHYNEYQMVKLARKLMEEEMNEVEHEHEESHDQPEASTSSATHGDV